MLKANDQLLDEKIAYAEEEIAHRKNKIAEITDIILCNRSLIDSLIFKRNYTRVLFDVEKNQAKMLKNSTTKIDDQEKHLREENVFLAGRIEKLEKEIAFLEETKKRLSKTKTHYNKKENAKTK